MFIKYLIIDTFYILYLLIVFICCLLEEKRKTIKGSINENGEKIYYTKDNKLYDNIKAEEYFKNEKDAEKAGYIKAKR